jgi:hypothetical protein
MGIAQLQLSELQLSVQPKTYQPRDNSLQIQTWKLKIAEDLICAARDCTSRGWRYRGLRRSLQNCVEACVLIIAGFRQEHSQLFSVTEAPAIRCQFVTLVLRPAKKRDEAYI